MDVMSETTGNISRSELAWVHVLILSCFIVVWLTAVDMEYYTVTQHHCWLWGPSAQRGELFDMEYYTVTDLEQQPMPGGELFVVDMEYYTVTHCTKRGIVRCGHGVLHCDSLPLWTSQRGELFCGHGVLHCDSLHKEGNCLLWTWSITLWLTAQRGELFVVYTVTH